MREPVPARITIELLPPTAHAEGWTARTTLGGGSRHASGSGDGDRATAGAAPGVIASEPRVDQPFPQGYEAAGCTCDEDWCGADHDNE